MRGEDRVHGLPLRRSLGSPPRAWGRHKPHLASLLADRFTPTCVGKTASACAPAHGTPVHPHVRGEDAHYQPRKTRTFGSPPRAWGRLLPVADSPPHDRFTPTCVGKTSGLRLGARGCSVHPHVRGEDITGSDRPCATSGSPPRAWGRPCQVGLSLRCLRFTPTCVGKTGGRRGRR